MCSSCKIGEDLGWFTKQGTITLFYFGSVLTCIQVMATWKELEQTAETAQSYAAITVALDSLPPDTPALPYLPIFIKQLSIIDQQNPDQWPDPDSTTGEALVNFHKLRLGKSFILFAFADYVCSFFSDNTATTSAKQIVQLSSSPPHPKLLRNHRTRAE